MLDFLQELIITTVTLFGSLVIALLAVKYDRRIENKRELHSILDGLVFESEENLRIARTIKKSTEDALKVIEKGGWSPIPDPKFVDIVYSRTRISEVFFEFIRSTRNNIFLAKLFECYAALQVVNDDIARMNKMKFEVLTQPNIVTKYIKEMLQKRIQVIEQVVEPSITEIYSILVLIDPRVKKPAELPASDKGTGALPSSVASVPASREKCVRIDHFFEIGLLLATILSASIFQYVSAKYQFQIDLKDVDKLRDLGFLFKELTIPVVVLILAWLGKELVPETFLKVLHPLKRFIKEFCWTFLSNFLVLELLSLIFLGFITDPPPIVNRRRNNDVSFCPFHISECERRVNHDFNQKFRK